MRNQVYVMGRFDLGPDEAFVVDVKRRWRRILHRAAEQHLGHHAGHSSTAPAASTRRSRCANEDGSYTYVISPVDPGVANWIDSDGLREGILTLRMAEFGEGGPAARTSARAAGWSSWTGLDAEVPHSARGSAPSNARRELADRRTAYLRRLPEGTI